MESAYNNDNGSIQVAHVRVFENPDDKIFCCYQRTRIFIDGDIGDYESNLFSYDMKGSGRSGTRNLIGVASELQ